MELHSKRSLTANKVMTVSKSRAVIRLRKAMRKEGGCDGDCQHVAMDTLETGTAGGRTLSSTSPGGRSSPKTLSA